MQKNKSNLNLKKGITVLFASFIMSLLLVVALSISDISRRQFLISSSSRESQKAFYIADTGVECALYKDFKAGGLPASGDEQTQGFVCNDQAFALDVDRTSQDTSTATTTYVVNPPSACDVTKPSLEIEVVKTKLSEAETFETVIRSKGYNTCDSNNPNRVERGLKVNY